MAASVFPSDEELFPLLVPQPKGSQFFRAFHAQLLKEMDNLNAPLTQAIDKSNRRRTETAHRRTNDAAQRYKMHALEVLEPWMDEYLKTGDVDSYPENACSTGKYVGEFHRRNPYEDIHENTEIDLKVDYLEALEVIWGRNEPDLEEDRAAPGLHHTLHRLYLAIHPIRLWKSLWRLVKYFLLLAAGWALVWYFKLGRYMGTINTVMADGFTDHEHTLLAFGYDCLRLLGVLLVAAGIMAVLYGLVKLVENFRDWRRQSAYRRDMDRLALDAYRAVRFYQLWAAHEGRTLNLRRAQAVLEEYAAQKGG